MPNVMAKRWFSEASRIGTEGIVEERDRGMALIRHRDAR